MEREKEKKGEREGERKKEIVSALIMSGVSRLKLFLIINICINLLTVPYGKLWR